MEKEPLPKSMHLKSKSLMLGGVFFMLPNLFYIYMGWFVRLRADDFCFSGTLRRFGFLKGLSVFYNTLSNRFSAFMVWSFSDLFGEIAIRFFIMLAIVLYAYAFFRAAKMIFQNYPIAFFISQALTFFTLYLAPNIHQGIYWRAAMVHYFLPIPLLLFLLLYVFKRPMQNEAISSKSILVFLISIFLAGLSESYAGMHGGVFALIFLYWLTQPGKKDNRHLLYSSLAAIAGVLVTLVIMILSPGNSLKFALEEQAADLVTVFTISFDSVFSFIFYSLRGLWLPIGILMALGFLSGFLFHSEGIIKIAKRQIIQAVTVIPFIVFFLIFCISAPTAYGMKAYPEQRVLTLAMSILLAGVFSLGFLLPFIVPHKMINGRFIKIGAMILLLIFSIYPLSAFRSLFDMAGVYRKRAQLWDSQQQEIVQQKAKGKKDLTVTALDSLSEMAEMREYDTFWVNLCAAQYYNVDTIRAVER